jgi:hypothetical protein
MGASTAVSTPKAPGARFGARQKPATEFLESGGQMPSRPRSPRVSRLFSDDHRDRRVASLRNVAEILETLTALGLARHTGDGRFAM